MAKIQRKTSAPKIQPAQPAGGIAGISKPKKRRWTRVKSKVLVQFTVQLATLQNAGLPIVRSLRILAGQQRPGPFRDAVAAVAEDVEGGDSLSVALAKHDGVFDELYLNMVKAGEAGGLLDEILERLAQFAEKAEEIKSKIVGALAYPIFVMGFAALVIFFVMAFVVPQFQEIFDQLGAKLPKPTEILIGVANFLKKSWWMVFLGIGLLYGIFHLSMRSLGFKRVVHRFMLRMPLFGVLARKNIVARFSRTLGTLLGAGVPILQALAIVRDSVSNVVVSEALDDVHRNVRQGETITQPMAESGVFDDIVVNMIDVGEESGNLDQMLLKVAGAYEREVDDAVTTIFRIVEPLILVLLALVVGAIVVSLFLPILQVMDQLAAGR